MQGVVDHTVDRILCDPKVVEKICQIKEEHGSVSLQFIYKFGLDGSKVKLKLVKLVKFTQTTSIKRMYSP